MNTQIYVGTYAKYNNGDLSGEWLDLADYSTAEELMEAMQAIHEDEEDPEYMIQDMEEHAEALGVEESMSEEDWEQVYEALEALEKSYLDIEAVQAYCKNTGEPINSDSIREAEEAYQGTYDSDEDFAQELAEEIGAVNHGASWPNNCIDWEWAAREIMYDYFEINGHYFRNL